MDRVYRAGAVGILAFVVAQTCQEFLHGALAITRFERTPMAAVLGIIFFTFVLKARRH